MNPSELKFQVEQAGHDPYFFTRDTMKLFGDTMKNYGVRNGGLVVTNMDETVEVWELYRKQLVKHGLGKSAFFSKATFARVFPK